MVRRQQRLLCRERLLCRLRRARPTVRGRCLPGAHGPGRCRGARAPSARAPSAAASPGGSTGGRGGVRLRWRVTLAHLGQSVRVVSAIWDAVEAALLEDEVGPAPRLPAAASTPASPSRRTAHEVRRRARQVGKLTSAASRASKRSPLREAPSPFAHGADSCAAATRLPRACHEIVGESRVSSARMSGRSVQHEGALPPGTAPFLSSSERNVRAPRDRRESA